MGKGSRGRRVLRAAIITFGVGFVAMIGLFAVAWAMTPIPDSTQSAATAQGSVIYYRDGKTVLAKQGVNRRNVQLKDVPKGLRDAVIAAENRSFYEDSGVSLKGTARAMWSTVTGKQLQGGSTITQQMVRNYYSGLSQERSAVRKLKEIMISLKVDRSESKDWVLEQYLNTIYFGRGANGVQAAADAYFRKDVGKLTVAEGAYLAAVIQQPSRFADPKGADLTAAKQRWQWVIDGMVQTGALTPAEAAKVKFPVLKEPKAVFTPEGQEGYMLDQIMAELRKRGYTDEMVNQGGLKIISTFDKKLMETAEQAVTSVLPEGTSPKVRTGLAAVDPATGEVLAFYGGRSYKANKFDNSFSAEVQAGSTFKAYALAAGLENGLKLGTRVYGNSPMRVASDPGHPIPNSGGASYGQVNLITAMRHSVNTAFVDIGQRVGLEKVAEAAEDAGIPVDQITPHEDAATLPLGVSSVSAVQNAAGFATFAANGVHRSPHVIRSIIDGDERIRITDKGQQVFSETTAADVTYTLTQVVTGGTGTAARLYDRPVAGKTGTTDKSASAWFTGYTPQLSVAVNMFRDDNKPVVVGGSVQYGGQYPAQIWRAFMTEAMEGKPVKQFPKPSDYGYAPSTGDRPYNDGGYGNYGDYGDQGDTAPPATPEQTAAPDPGPTTAPDPDGNGNGGDGTGNDDGTGGDGNDGTGNDDGTGGGGTGGDGNGGTGNDGTGGDGNGGGSGNDGTGDGGNVNTNG
ncbi:transglycosylase domain-containing protein [Planobispora siamensis]|uniref:transglycosylase domain-containing protein n=1 Tax=Planobispora siamensis TaxID=936338 RepID=UPI001EF32EDC|nr:transglycosylase domain-containing protein [Planobispora siamensis]